MTYDFVEYLISYRNYPQIPIWSLRGKDCVHVVRKSYRTVPKSLPIRRVRKDHFEIAFYNTLLWSTVRYLDVRYRMAKCHGIIIPYRAA